MHKSVTFCGFMRSTKKVLKKYTHNKNSLFFAKYEKNIHEK